MTSDTPTVQRRITPRNKTGKAVSEIDILRNRIKELEDMINISPGILREERLEWVNNDPKLVVACLDGNPRLSEAAINEEISAVLSRLVLHNVSVNSSTGEVNLRVEGVVTAIVGSSEVGNVGNTYTYDIDIVNSEIDLRAGDRLSIELPAKIVMEVDHDYSCIVNP